MNIKKIIFALGFLAVTFLSSAQEYVSPDAQSSMIAYNSLNFSQTNPVLGTARYSGMAGAMGALGGDATTMRDNPAGLGVYRSSDITITPNFSVANDHSVGFNINNFGLVLNFRNSGNRTGYVTSSLGITYNRLKNFNRFSDLGGDDLGHSMVDYIPPHATDALYDDAYALGLIDDDGVVFGWNGEDFDAVSNQTRYSENGSISEWNFAYGLNISNRFYFGFSTAFVNLNYQAKMLYDEAVAINPGDTWYMDNLYEVNGSGFNFKFGAIAAPADFMRIGVALHTPTFYNIDEFFSEDLSYNGYFANGEFPRENSYRSDLQTPLKLQGSLGFIIGKTAIIGLEYQYEDFTAMRFSSGNVLDQGSKNLINNEMKITHTAKAGAEVRVVDGLSLRAGFAFVTNPSIELSPDVYSNPENFLPYPLAQPQNTFYYTGGIGYKGKSFYADLAYVHQVREESFFQYLPQEEFSPYALKLHNSNITATFGFRF
ncbi:MAG: hypothetical protein LBR52_00895 [Prevotellaceae bacterium]|jgi:hypothetical protein|nr:hypothetical protein [Prevotellaceae bacterium]